MRTNVTVDGGGFDILAHMIRNRGDAEMVQVLDVVEKWSHRWNSDFREMPVNGEIMIVRTTMTMRYMPYKPTSNEFKSGKAGRWQWHDGRSWASTDRPQGDWLLLTDYEADKHGRSRGSQSSPTE